MSSSACPHFDDCSSPLCPEDPQSLTHGSWFCDEEICPVRAYARLSWVRRQRKLIRTLGQNFEVGSFTVTMLQRDFIIRPGLTGLDPDRGPADKTEVDWLRAHPTKAALTDDARAELRARAAKMRASNKGFSAEKGAQIKTHVTPAAEAVLLEGGGAVKLGE